MSNLQPILAEYVDRPIASGRAVEDDKQTKHLIGLIRAVPDKTVGSSDVLWYANKALNDRKRRQDEENNWND